MAKESLKDEREESTLQIRNDRDIELWEREPGGHPGRHYSLPVELLVRAVIVTSQYMVGDCIRRLRQDM